MRTGSLSFILCYIFVHFFRNYQRDPTLWCKWIILFSKVPVLYNDNRMDFLADT